MKDPAQLRVGKSRVGSVDDRSGLAQRCQCQEADGAPEAASYSLGLICTALSSGRPDTNLLISCSASRFISMYLAGIHGRKTSSAETCTKARDLVNDVDDGLAEIYAPHARNAESRLSAAYDVLGSVTPNGFEDHNASVREETKPGRFPSLRASLYFAPSIRVPSVWTTAVASDRWCA